MIKKNNSDTYYPLPNNMLIITNNKNKIKIIEKQPELTNFIVNSNKINYLVLIYRREYKDEGLIKSLFDSEFKNIIDMRLEENSASLIKALLSEIYKNILISRKSKSFFNTFIEIYNSLMELSYLFRPGFSRRGLLFFRIAFHRDESFNFMSADDRLYLSFPSLDLTETFDEALNNVK
jgi:hypothetical protein